MTERNGVVCALLARLTGIAVCTLIALPTYALSDERCEFGDVLGSMLVRPGGHAEEFRIRLAPPDYQSLQAIQRHLIYSNIWARVLSAELSTKTDGFCSAVITPFFPDLRVYLIANLSRGESEQDATICRRSLQDLIAIQPEPESVENATLLEAKTFSERILSPAGYMSAAGNVLTAALGKIYQAGSVMHALVSVDEAAIQAQDARAFLKWFQAQTSASAVSLIPIVICSADLNQDSPQVERRADMLPSSGIVAPAPITLSERAVGKASASYLRHAVIVGDDQAVVNARGASATMTKYCNQERVFPINRDSGSAPIRIRCLRAALYSIDGWTVFFCDTSECKTDGAAEIVAKTIAGDDDVIAMARARAPSVKQRGPYLVEIEATDK